jgi:hypothetical protein
MTDSKATEIRPAVRGAVACGLAALLTVSTAGAASAGSRSHGSDAHPQPATSQPGHTAPHHSTSRQHAVERPETARHKASRHKASRPEASRSASTDPRGNNGTIKIDGVSYDAGVDNEPHPGCEFRVTFFGFDAGQTADITMTGIAPTGGGTLLAEHGVPTSSDLAGGAANDPDGATRIYTADDLGLTALTPHPKQGYHVKVTVDSLEASGGAKQKVLWIAPCESAPTGAVAQTVRALRADVAPAVFAAPLRISRFAVPAAAVAADQGETRPASAPATQVEAVSLGSSASPGAAASGARTAPSQQASVLAVAAALGTLPFTGASGVLTLLLLGAGTAIAGFALRRAAARS